jgi:ureidoglycolate lyase
MPLIAHPLTRANYRQYGDVFDTRTDQPTVEANQGTARRLNMLGSLHNLRPAAKVKRYPNVQLNICTFASQPRPIPDGTFEIKILERHFYSTQIFIPMTAPHRYLVIVALNGMISCVFEICFSNPS